MSLKLALPKGWLESNTASLLEKAGFTYANYHESSRSYRPKSLAFPSLFTKVFHEKDIAIQVAIGNYDLAICGLDWIQELLIKYHRDAIVKVKDLGYGRRNLYVGTSRSSSLHSLADVKNKSNAVRIVSEYPNLAEAFALGLRLKSFKVLPVWGSSEAYPPEHADLAIVSATSSEELRPKDLAPIAKILTGNAWIIANRNSLEGKDMSSLLSPFYQTDIGIGTGEELSISKIDSEDDFESPSFANGTVSLALPDGHQQTHTIKFMKNAGVKIRGYLQLPPTKRPLLEFSGVSVKVIRPQDMPLQVANGNFDLAITGQDWLRDQHYQFPASPVKELVNLGFGLVRIVAAVSNKMSVGSTRDLRVLLKNRAATDLAYRLGIYQHRR